jgi:hypothetical protein
MPSYVPQTTNLTGNVWRLVSQTVPPELTNTVGLTARFWVTGMGWVATNDLGTNSRITLDWNAPPGVDLSTARYRSQIYKDNNPAFTISEPRSFYPKLEVQQFSQAGPAQYSFNITGDIFPFVVLESSTNLTSWAPAVTNKNFRWTWSLTNSINSTPSKQFFRARSPQ